MPLKKKAKKNKDLPADNLVENPPSSYPVPGRPSSNFGTPSEPSEPSAPSVPSTTSPEQCIRQIRPRRNATGAQYQDAIFRISKEKESGAIRGTRQRAPDLTPSRPVAATSTRVTRLQQPIASDQNDTLPKPPTKATEERARKQRERNRVQ
ncbi:hypothetical protein M422DRAFT_254267, partial [Sphaerobolus stellatus SS14]